MVFVFVIIVLMVAIFYIIISRLGDSSVNNEYDENLSNSTVNYVPKKFLSNNEYNFLIKFIDLENELHVNIVPQVNFASIITKVSNS